jgi:hypothetical protein
MTKLFNGKRLKNREIDRIVDEITHELLAQLAKLTKEKRGKPC